MTPRPWVTVEAAAKPSRNDGIRQQKWQRAGLFVAVIFALGLGPVTVLHSIQTGFELYKIGFDGPVTTNLGHSYAFVILSGLAFVVCIVMASFAVGGAKVSSAEVAAPLRSLRCISFVCWNAVSA